MDVPLIVLPVIGTVPAWRAAARGLLARGVPDAVWQVGTASPDLFATETADPALAATPLTLPRDAIAEIETALCHADPERFARAYLLLRRLASGAVRWGDRTDPVMKKLLDQAKTVRRAIHKMHAFVRFREVAADRDRRAFMAWFEPDHPVVEAATPFFAKRFGDMDWAILTPQVTARFVGGRLDYQLTAPGTVIPEDATEALWRTYYASIFNPARLMVDAMVSEMPRKYWKNLPEADLIPDLIRNAGARAAAMEAAAPSVASPRLLTRAKAMVAQSLPDVPTEGLAGLRAAAGCCTRCPLHASATQVVFGVGPEDAPLMIIGEQPGDTEDLTGLPFSGPAGQVFDAEAVAAGLDRTAAYVTNAVKHFKFLPRGKRRIHQRPNAGEVMACRWWLDLERALIRPRLILAMGATALASLTSRGEGLLTRRGTVEVARDGTPIFITVHPSYILRLPDADLQTAERARFRADLHAVAEMVRNLTGT
jgi:probable DNA metabolism protein